MINPSKAPPGVDPTVPNVARIHDYFLGGPHYYPADRERAELMLAQFPATRALLEGGREFLAYAVGVAAAAGIGQFLDVGSGLPTTGNTHQIAGPAARVVYGDHDPDVVAHGAHLVAGLDRVAFLPLDAGDPAAVLAAATDPARGAARLDLAAPVCVVMTGVLHFVETDPALITGYYLDALAAGSMLIATHATGDPEAIARARLLYTDTNFAGYGRTVAQLEAAFARWDLSPSGLAPVEFFTRGGEVAPIGDAEHGMLAAVIGTKR